jgi:carbon storage regulator CsrA
MLVLSRKSGERVSIGREIEVTVLGIHKGRVKLGFLVPPEIPIHREEAQRNAGTHPAQHFGLRSNKAKDVK